MLRIGMLGIGNAGNQVLVSAKTIMPDVPLFAINCSKQDIATLPKDIKSLVIGDGKGAGKDRKEAKKSLSVSAQKLFTENEDIKNFIESVDFLFIVSSTGGGSGSGISLMISKIISKLFPNVTVVSVGILPSLKEALSSQVNTLEYLQELYTNLDSHTYLLYDNNKLSNLPSYKMMDEINLQVAKDINVLRGYYNLATKYASIDDKELGLILRTPGRILVASLYDIKETDIDESTGDVVFENMLMCDLKKAGHVEMQNDKIINRFAVITNLSQNLFEKFDTSVPFLQKNIGTPVESFEHLKINDERKLPNNIFVILSGATKVNERIIKINNKIDDINKAQEEIEDDSELDLHDIVKLNQKRQNRPVEEKSGSVNLTDIFGEFGI